MKEDSVVVSKRKTLFVLLLISTLPFLILILIFVYLKHEKPITFYNYLYSFGLINVVDNQKINVESRYGLLLVDETPKFLTKIAEKDGGLYYSKYAVISDTSNFSSTGASYNDLGKIVTKIQVNSFGKISNFEVNNHDSMIYWNDTVAQNLPGFKDLKTFRLIYPSEDGIEDLYSTDDIGAMSKFILFDNPVKYLRNGSLLYLVWKADDNNNLSDKTLSENKNLIYQFPPTEVYVIN